MWSFLLKQDIAVDFSYEKYIKLKSWYIREYKNLILIYLNKENSKKYLDRFIKKEGKRFLPKEIEVEAFVLYYYNLYKQIGTEIEKEIV
ncbi:hypothetical protein [Nitratiruptor sp. YY09-18]|uniref:invasion protein CiaB n=1 Tax=Nitratiruptor sp. YY09-18 TaxID=2724901 RepID=UPI001915731F|nr:hypothetical protein [Nitratiruptor sp. YY09-18]BCD68758.1 hypothetical protein NitYY0918_C1675 [Nitratiruptor sp. YY09-18]